MLLYSNSAPKFSQSCAVNRWMKTTPQMDAKSQGKVRCAICVLLWPLYPSSACSSGITHTCASKQEQRARCSTGDGNRAGASRNSPGRYAPCKHQSTIKTLFLLHQVKSDKVGGAWPRTDKPEDTDMVALITVPAKLNYSNKIPPPLLQAAGNAHGARGASW